MNVVVPAGWPVPEPLDERLERTLPSQISGFRIDHVGLLSATKH